MYNHPIRAVAKPCHAYYVCRSCLLNVQRNALIGPCQPRSSLSTAAHPTPSAEPDSSSLLLNSTKPHSDVEELLSALPPKRKKVKCESEKNGVHSSKDRRNLRLRAGHSSKAGVDATLPKGAKLTGDGSGQSTGEPLPEHAKHVVKIRRLKSPPRMNHRKIKGEPLAARLDNDEAKMHGDWNYRLFEGSFKKLSDALRAFVRPSSENRGRSRRGKSSQNATLGIPGDSFTEYNDETKAHQAEKVLSSEAGVSRSDTALADFEDSGDHPSGHGGGTVQQRRQKKSSKSGRTANTKELDMDLAPGAKTSASVPAKKAAKSREHSKKDAKKANFSKQGKEENLGAIPNVPDSEENDPQSLTDSRSAPPSEVKSAKRAQRQKGRRIRVRRVKSKSREPSRKNAPTQRPRLGRRSNSRSSSRAKAVQDSEESDIKLEKDEILLNESSRVPEKGILQISDVDVTPLSVENSLVPGLSHGLERVLFNPGIYHLRDPRSRVFNFDPYLQKIMPVAEFDFDSLKEYVTSSQDEALRDLALGNNRKYIGSSSSMTSVLSHFHFLLSQWRKINVDILSQRFPAKPRSFTKIMRSPSAIFLRWKDGVYAVDADKEFDSANVLMSLGKSMEKLFTLPMEQYERYRKSSDTKITEEERSAPEAYHYSTLGDFLMRSQLDAHDPRLPGTGMFDLKTRAVVSVRMDAKNYERGMGYQIKNRFGEWESYEREYFDMMRSAFLKYSLQVRMGRMDGIFVAFHNVERIFGFQYVSLPEMDYALHGDWNTVLGDREFQFSVGLFNQILDRATKKFPQTSLRLHFETRETKDPFMYIFAEPVTDEQIETIQAANKEEIERFEARLLGKKPKEDAPPSEAIKATAGVGKEDDSSEASAALNPNDEPTPKGDAEQNLVAQEDSSAPADNELLDSLRPQDQEEGETGEDDKATTFLLGLTLKVQNLIDGKRVVRPEHLEAHHNWTIEYKISQLTKKRAENLYKMCKSRRRRALEDEDEDEDEDLKAVNYYLRNLRNLSKAGEEWRDEQDKADHGKEPTVL